MPARSSPTVKRRRLAAELRRYRDAASLTIDEVAERLEWSTAKISRIENARVGVLPRDVKFLLTTYGLSDQDEAWDVLLTLARESRQRGWWQQYGEAVPDWFEVYVGLEAEAATIFGYDAEFVPGILQTEDYAWAVIRAGQTKNDPDTLNRRLAARMARQEILKRPDPPEIWAVLDESVISRPVGGPGIMRAQLENLIELSTKPNTTLTLQVLPFTVGAHPGMNGPFVILDFNSPTDPPMVYLETATDGLYLDEPADVERYNLRFNHLVARALGPDESRTMIAALAERMA